MGQLGLATRKGKNKLPYRSYNYSNENAVAYLVEYVTRSRPNEERADSLITYGGVGVGYDFIASDMICQMLAVQNAYDIHARKGRRMHHEVFNMYDLEVAQLNFNSDILWQIGRECSQIYYRIGHQVVFAVHWEPEKHWHIHFAINAVNYITGRKMHSSMMDIEARNQIFNQILYKYQMIAGFKVVPIETPEVPISFEDGREVRWSKSKSFYPPMPMRKWREFHKNEEYLMRYMAETDV